MKKQIVLFIAACAFFNIAISMNNQRLVSSNADSAKAILLQEEIFIKTYVSPESIWGSSNIVNKKNDFSYRLFDRAFKSNRLHKIAEEHSIFCTKYMMNSDYITLIENMMLDSDSDSDLVSTESIRCNQAAIESIKRVKDIIKNQSTIAVNNVRSAYRYKNSMCLFANVALTGACLGLICAGSDFYCPINKYKLLTGVGILAAIGFGGLRIAYEPDNQIEANCEIDRCNTSIVKKLNSLVESEENDTQWK